MKTQTTLVHYRRNGVTYQHTLQGHHNLAECERLALMIGRIPKREIIRFERN
jgi:hypothetical protein